MTPTLFVTIAAYTDPELPRTLRRALDTARWPDRLRFGVCFQADPKAPIDVAPFRDAPGFRWVDTTIDQSQGGPWARNICQALWRGEPCTLQIDSHMDFEPEWDARLIEMLEAVPSEKAILTMNAPLYHEGPDGNVVHHVHMGVPATRVSGWSEAGGWAPWLDFAPPNQQQPGRTRFVNGNFGFARGIWNVEVPQDPGHYYWGEEFSITVRSFTWGYDLFLPSEAVVWHKMHDGPPRRHWEHGEDTVARRNREGLARLHKLIFTSEGHALGPYGLGHARSLRDYEVYAGFDFQGRRAHPDVFTGANPDPVTLHSPAEWDRCLTAEQAQDQGLLA